MHRALGPAQVDVDVHGHGRAVELQWPGRGPEVLKDERMIRVVAENGVQAGAPLAVDVEHGVRVEEATQADRVLRGDRGEVVVDHARGAQSPWREPVELPGVEAKHAGLRRSAAGRDRGADGVHRARECGVVVRVVAAPDDACVSHEGRQRGQGPFVDLETNGALAREVLRRTKFHVWTEPAEGLGLLVKALEPEGGPPAGGLEEDAAQTRVPFEHTEGDELRAGEHLLERVRHGMEHQRVEGAVCAERRHDD